VVPPRSKLTAAAPPTPSEQVGLAHGLDLQKNNQKALQSRSNLVGAGAFYTFRGARHPGPQTSNMAPMPASAKYGVDLVISAKDKAYERFCFRWIYDNGTA